MASDADDSQKTEEPTAKRLTEARARGQVPNSREVVTWLILFSIAVIIAMASPTIMREMANFMVMFVESPHDILFTRAELYNLFFEALKKIFAILMLPLLIFVLVAVGASLVQNGIVFSPKAIEPKLSKINPLEGVKRLASGRQLVETLKGVFKIILVGFIGVIALLPELNRLDILPSLSVFDLLDEIYFLVLRILVGALAFLLVVAIADVFFQRYQHIKKLRMTKQEIKEEFKNQEGDPQIKAKLRQLRMEKARQRMMQAVPKADVVITNPTHYAVALAYEPTEMDAPILLAKGQDEIAFRMRAIAKAHDIELVSNPPLARALYSSAEIDQEIPVEHFRAVAEVISYVFALRGKKVPQNDGE